ncbi:MAG: hypothetical protein QW318_06305 [Candidatus Caldarchaeum sp.]
MPEITLDVSQDSWDSEFVPLVGSFVLEITNAELGVSQSQKPKLTLTYGVVSPETMLHKGRQVSVVGRRVVEHVSLAENASWTLKQRLTTAGVPFRFEAQENGKVKVTFAPEAFIGRRVRANLIVEEGADGRSYTRVESTQPA